MKGTKYRKVRYHCHYTEEYRGAAHSMCNLKYTVPKNIPIVFHNGSNYDLYFIVKELAEGFQKTFHLFRKNTDKYITCTVHIEKDVTRIDKNGEKRKPLT